MMTMADRVVWRTAGYYPMQSREHADRLVASWRNRMMSRSFEPDRRKVGPMKILLLATAAILMSPLQAQLHCSFTHSDIACGPVLRGAIHKNHNHKYVLTYATTHAPVNAGGVLAFGMAPLRVQFPSKCFLLVQPVILISYPASNKGEARMSFEFAKLVAGSLITPDQVNALGVSGSEGCAGAAQPEESGRGRGVSHVEVR
jgi:hypothetical protein